MVDQAEKYILHLRLHLLLSHMCYQGFKVCIMVYTPKIGSHCVSLAGAELCVCRTSYKAP